MSAPSGCAHAWKCCVMHVLACWRAAGMSGSSGTASPASEQRLQGGRRWAVIGFAGGASRAVLKGGCTTVFRQFVVARCLVRQRRDTNAFEQTCFCPMAEWRSSSTDTWHRNGAACHGVAAKFDGLHFGIATAL